MLIGSQWKNEKMTNVKVQRKTVLSSKEIDKMLKNAEKIPDLYQQLRAKAIVCILKIFGKRRLETAQIGIDDLETTEEDLIITFYVTKKRTKQALATQRRKSVSLKSKYAKPIVRYLEYLKNVFPNTKYLFPSTRYGFDRLVSVDLDRHISGSQIYRIIKDLNPNAWVHLFRETKGAEIVIREEKEKGSADLMTIYKVKRTLDLKDTKSAFKYVDRYGIQKVETEEGEKEKEKEATE